MAHGDSIRHGWAWLSSDWKPLALNSDPEKFRAIINWNRRRKPFVVAGYTNTHGSPQLRLGLSTLDKRRLGFTAPMAAVTRQDGPPALRDVISVALPEWIERLGEIHQRATHIGIVTHVYGSLAWTYRSSVPYLRADSDVDLLISSGRATLEETMEFLQWLISFDDSPRLDGELVVNDLAVSWREFAQTQSQLLAKRNGEAMLIASAEVRARFCGA